MSTLIFLHVTLFLCEEICMCMPQYYMLSIIRYAFDGMSICVCERDLRDIVKIISANMHIYSVDIISSVILQNQSSVISTE